jgi:hypothetical protein
MTIISNAQQNRVVCRCENFLFKPMGLLNFMVRICFPNKILNEITVQCVILIYGQGFCKLHVHSVISSC